MLNPVTELLEWIKKQDHEIQAEIAFLMSAEHPSFDFYGLPLETENQIQTFCSKIEEFSGSEVGNGGFVVAFRAIFDFTIVRRRGTIDGWRQPEAAMQAILESNDPGQPPRIKETAQKMLNELPARREKWIAICNSWKELKDSVLSDEAIEAWENDNVLARGKDFVKPIVVNCTQI